MEKDIITALDWTATVKDRLKRTRKDSNLTGDETREKLDELIKKSEELYSGILGLLQIMDK